MARAPRKSSKKSAAQKWREKAEREGVKLEVLPESERVTPREEAPEMVPPSFYSLSEIHAKKMWI